MTDKPLHALKAPVRIGEAPFGTDVRALAAAASEEHRTVIYVARDERQARAALRLATFFVPELETTLIPAWDCLPYDRTSPSPESAATRCAGLATLADLARRTEAGEALSGHLFATTGNALAQRVAPLGAWDRSSLSLKLGDEIDADRLTDYLSINGYARTSTVREKGEYAVRGGIVDIFPPTALQPVRLDMFGDTLDELRAFDPESQRSTDTLDQARFAPVSELLFDEISLARFRENYLEAFGSPMGDPMYEAARAGIRRQGLEHWLPLFHEGLVPLTGLAPASALWGLGHLALEAARERHEQAEDYHATRVEAAGDGQARVLDPHRLYVSPETLETELDSRAAAHFTPRQGDLGASLNGHPGRDFAPERMAGEVNVFESVTDHVRTRIEAGDTVILAAWSPGSASRLVNVLEDHGLDGVEVVDTFGLARDKRVVVAELPLEAGVRQPGLTVISEQDILGDRLATPRRRRAASKYIAEVAALTAGDLVVHVDHGIAKYTGLTTVDAAGAPHDCLELQYAEGDKLFLPVENIELISRYGAAETEAALDRLGGASWQARKARAKKRIMEMAEALIAIAAERELRTAEPIESGGGVYEEFAARFPYEETDDQMSAIADVMGDLASGKPMDRLVCGDVGFGKTEVALRAAFVAAMTGQQVAVIAPTTLLARQHYNTFAERFKGWPIDVRPLSRLVPQKDATETRARLKDGRCDVVVGTHALLSKSVEFDRLGLLIVDEEQRFGVKHKERLKSLKAGVHVLTLSATPIPRTLQQALTGIRELSIIATPPVDRLSVRTYVTEFDDLTLREAVLREKYRGGQAFVVAPRISDLGKLEAFLRDKVPEVSYVVAHGQMGASELDDIMDAFYEGKYDVLLSTTIVESGLDIPRANTLIIYRADMFGLAQLYQLRGRVGRSKLRAYAYLTTPRDMAITEAAEKRLRVLQSLDSLGAGFMLASHDLDMRGGGNLLGEEQSGHIREVGVELYQSMLEDAVNKIQSGDKDDAVEQWSPSINLGTAVLIPESYVGDLNERLSLYRRLSNIDNDRDREQFAAELIDRFGPLPDETQQLLDITSIKARCKQLGVSKLDAGPKGAVLAFRNDTPLDPQALMAFVSEHANRLKLRPDGKLVFTGQWSGTQKRAEAVRRLLSELTKLLPAEEKLAA